MNQPTMSNKTAPKRKPVLPPSTPFRTKRIPLACSILPILTTAFYGFYYLGLNYVSAGNGLLVIVCTGISMKILLYLVPKYAPDQKKLEGSLRKLKSVKFSLAICAG